MSTLLMIKSQIQNIIVQYNFNSLEDQLKLHLYVQKSKSFSLLTLHMNYSVVQLDASLFG